MPQIEIRRILCPTDFSDFSMCALEHAAALARWCGAEILVLHVVQPVFADVPVPVSGDSRERLAADLRTFAAPAEAARVRVRTVIEDGAPVSTIVRTAAESSADLVVMGTHGRSGFEHFLLGSVTEKLVRKAPCPVLAVHDQHAALPRQGPPYARVLCPTDFSEAAARAVALASSIACEPQSRLTLMHVVETLPPDDALSGGGVDLVDHLRRREEALGARLRQLVPADAACTPEHVLVRGKPSREIVRQARDSAADLVVMGVHGHNPVHVAVFGSTAHAVVRDAPCAVLTVREKQA